MNLLIFFVDIMNRKLKVKKKQLGHLVQISLLYQLTLLELARKGDRRRI